MFPRSDNRAGVSYPAVLAAWLGTSARAWRVGARWQVALVAACALAVLACSSSISTKVPEAAPVSAEAVVVASFNFPESVLLAEIYGQALEDAGIPVTLRHEVGPREIMEPALEQGLVDVVPEYLGSALAFFEPGASIANLDAAGVRSRLTGILADKGVLVLAHAPAENQNGIVVTSDTAARLGLATISDLVPHAGELTFGGPPECRERPFCLTGLQQSYGLTFERFLPLDSGGRQTRAALASGEIDVGLLFTTDGHLAEGDFVLLADDRTLQPAENVVPLVRGEVAERWGDVLVDRVDAVSAVLGTDTLVELNAEVGIEREPPAEVASDWLEAQGLGRN